MSSDGSIFYAVQVPEGTMVPETMTVEPYYTNRLDALGMLKKLKPARMKVFSTREQAEEFYNEPSTKANTQTVRTDNLTSSSSGTETPSYSSVRIQELVKFRFAIEKGNITTIHDLVNSNPRYLIASGDTPTILQERFRYNALHSAAIKGQTAAAEVILNYLSDSEFFTKLFPGDSEDSRMNRMKFALDLYLNTPDRGFNETPLHFASKYGHISMVELLVNETAVKKDVVNKDGQTVAQIACSRQNSQHKRRILEILQGQYYVPLYRSESDDVAPVVGEPWTPDNDCGTILQPPSPNTGAESSTDVHCISSPLRCVHQHRLPQINVTSSASRQRCTAGGQMVVKAVAGPMSPQQAQLFKRNWSSPNSNRSPSITRNHDSLLKYSARKDPYKGLELVGRCIATEMKVDWSEYWDFLECSVDISLPDGLRKLEEYFSKLETTATTEEVKSSLTTDQGGGDGGGRRLLSTPTTNAGLGSIAMTPPGNQCANLNTTDEELSSMFSVLSINSPTACMTQMVQTPAAASGDWGASCNDTQSAKNRSGVQQASSSMLPSDGDHKPQDTAITPSFSDTSKHNISAANTPKRSLIEYMVPSIAPYMDQLRAFWPFGKGGFTPQKASPSTSFHSPVENVSTVPTYTRGDTGVITPVHTSPVKAKIIPKVFIKGGRPCKVDTDVLKAMDGATIDELVYPSLSRWHNNVTAFSSQDQESWESPVTLRHRAKYRKGDELPKRRLLIY